MPVLQDLRIETMHLISALIASILLVAIVMVPVLGLAYLLSWITGRSVIDGGMLPASIIIWLLLSGITCLISYLKDK